MKLILVFLTLMFICPKQQNKLDLMGKWKLVKVEVEGETLIPSTDFFLIISEDRISFNTDVNECSAEPSITETTIEFERTICTRACCEGRNDLIGKLNLYRGNYSIKKDTLIIQNNRLKSYLAKMEG